MQYYKPHPSIPDQKIAVEVTLPVEYIAGNYESSRFVMDIPDEIAHQLNKKVVCGNTVERASAHMSAVFNEYYTHLKPKTKTKIIRFNVRNGVSGYEKVFGIDHEVLWRVQQPGMPDRVENEDGSKGGYHIGGDSFDEKESNWMTWTETRERFFIEAEARVEELKQYIAGQMCGFMYSSMDDEGKLL